MTTTEKPTESLEPWEDNSIQFPRLIAEAEAAGIWSDACDMHGAGTSALEDMAASMDLDVSEVFELIERAQMKWDYIKSQI